MKNGIFVDKMDQEITSINNDTGNSSLGWEQAKKCNQRPDELGDPVPSPVGHSVSPQALLVTTLLPAPPGFRENPPFVM